jgi:branched-chain amino acid transport system substrate-binding protein
MKKKALLGLLSFMLVVGIIVAGCAKPTPTPTPTPAPAPPAPTAPESIKIGIMISLVGYDSMLGKPAQAGYELAVEKINQDGGVYVKEYDKKIPLELIIMDMESDADKAIARAEALNEQNVVAATGTTLISSTSDIWEKNKVAAVTTLVSQRSLWERGFKYWFSLGKLNEDTVKSTFEVFANLPKDIRPTKWALWEEQSDWIAELFTIARKLAPNYGFDFVYEGKYAMLATDMSPLII